MTRKWTRRQALAAGVGLCVATQLPAAPPKLDTFTGKVRPLADLVRPLGTKLDADAAPLWLALVSDDGKIYPLIKDDGARVFFADKEVLDRPMQVNGRLLPGSQLLQVIEVHSLKKGVPHDLYYWCDICTIRSYANGPCACCLAPVELREVPLKE